jgi:predicted metal-dependent hydrolase
MNKVLILRQIYQYGDRNIEYTLVKSKRRKTSEIIVNEDEDELILRILFHKSIAEVDNLIDSRFRWIITRQKDFREKRSGLVTPTFSEASKIPYLGLEYEIQVIKRDKIDFRIKIRYPSFFFN